MSSLSVRLADNPLAGFLLGEAASLGSPFAAADATGHGVAAVYRSNAGSLFGVTTGVAGALASGSATAAAFDGGNGLVAVGDTAALNLTGQGTLQLRLKLAAFPGNGQVWCLAGKGSAGSDAEGYRILLIGTAGAPVVSFGRYDGSTTREANWTVTGWATNTWHNLAGSYDGASYKINFDGVDVATAASGVGLAASTQQFFIAAEGLNGAGLARFAPMTAAYVFVYPTGLSAARLAEHYAADTASSWTAAQTAYLALGRGQFVHFSAATFQPDENYASLLDPSAFAPTADPAYMVAQWVAAGRTLGAKYAILTASHGDGFRMYPSGQTAYGIASSPWYAANGNFDVCGRFATACRAKGLKVGYYVSIVDGKFEATHPGWAFSDLLAWTVAKVTEIATAYTPDVMWIDNVAPDGYSDSQVPFATLRAAIVAHAPNCVVIGNGHGGDLSHSDIAEFEHAISDPPVGNTLPSELSATIYQTNYLWFNHNLPGADTQAVLSSADIAALFSLASARSSNALLNTPPNRSGLIPDSQMAVLRAFATATPKAPLPAQVASGTPYGPNGDDYTGTLNPTTGASDMAYEKFPTDGTLVASAALTISRSQVMRITPSKSTKDGVKLLVIASSENTVPVIVDVQAYRTPLDDPDQVIPPANGSGVRVLPGQKCRINIPGGYIDHSVGATLVAAGTGTVQCQAVA